MADQASSAAEAAADSTTRATVSSGTIGGSSNSEEVVYYSFMAPHRFASLFCATGHPVDHRLTQIETDCKCSIRTRSRRHLRNHRAFSPGVTVEVLMDECGGNYGDSVRRLSGLVASVGGRWCLQRTVRRLRLANGTQKYRVTHPGETAVSPDSGHLEDSSTSMAAGQSSVSTDGGGGGGGSSSSSSSSSSASVVMSFADEVNGHWSLCSTVSPFLELKQPPVGAALAKNLWVHGVRLLAECTRLLAAQTAAESLQQLVATSHGRSAACRPGAQDSCPSSSDGDSSALRGLTDAVSRNYSHEPERNMVIFVTALLCSPLGSEPGQDTIDNFVTSSSSSLEMMAVHAVDASKTTITPGTAEPLPQTEPTTGLRGHHPALQARQAQATMLSSSIYDAAYQVRVARRLHCESQLYVARSDCMSVRTSLRCGKLDQALRCPGAHRRCHHQSEQCVARAGSSSVQAHLCAAEAQAAVGVKLAHQYHDGAAPATQPAAVEAMRASGEAATPSELVPPRRGEAVGQRGGYATAHVGLTSERAPTTAQNAPQAASSSARQSGCTARWQTCLTPCQAVPTHQTILECAHSRVSRLCCGNVRHCPPTRLQCCRLRACVLARECCGPSLWSHSHSCCCCVASLQAAPRASRQPSASIYEGAGGPTGPAVSVQLAASHNSRVAAAADAVAAPTCTTTSWPDYAASVPPVGISPGLEPSDGGGPAPERKLAWSSVCQHGRRPLVESCRLPGERCPAAAQWQQSAWSGHAGAAAETQRFAGGWVSAAPTVEHAGLNELSNSSSSELSRGYHACDCHLQLATSGVAQRSSIQAGRLLPPATIVTEGATQNAAASVASVSLGAGANAAAFPRSCGRSALSESCRSRLHRPPPHQLVPGCQQHRLSCASQELAAPLAGLHNHGGESHRTDDLAGRRPRRAQRRLSRQVKSTEAVHTAACTEQGGLSVQRATWCQQGHVAVSRAAQFEGFSAADAAETERPPPDTSKWPQTFTMASSGIGKLEWSYAWPSAALLQAANPSSLAMLVASGAGLSRIAAPNDAVLIGPDSGQVVPYSELVWESRRRTQLTQPSLN